MLLKKMQTAFDKADAVDIKIRNLLSAVQVMPETKSDLISLIKYASLSLVSGAERDINVDVIHSQLRACKQVLVATDNYYYI